MNKNERISIIKNILMVNKFVYVGKLACKFNVTERTIRRDITSLVNAGIAEPFYGGASFVSIDNDRCFKNIGLNNIMVKEGGGEYNNIVINKAPKDEMVFVLGSFNIDIVSELSEFPKVGETVRSISTNFYAGGKGANQATAAAKVNNNVHLMAKIGCDDLGKKASNYLSVTDVNSLTLLEDNEKPTGNAIVFVSKGTNNNFIAINLGANENIKKSEVVAAFDKIKKSKVFLTQLENNFDITKLAINLAKENNVPVILNPAPYNEVVKDILTSVDVITPNEIEAEGLSGIHIQSIEDAKKAAEIIHQLGVEVVIITLGSKGAVMFNGTEFKHYPSFKSVVVDTSGAGDSFNGSLAACLANKYSLDYAIKFASAFASLAVERKGASNMPSYDLVQNRLLNENF
ncbi:PfkB family carbohydrate kinase [Photobacterium sp.]|uniref:PfkB family carbohydrate kinase n=1 Tax=Photobacterium sp. TaxID=660 RepID=UPI00299DF8EE|nr:PfkB family carbohydrate kinase [Photobacterium sp.]MDX1303375.1 PfkB family carbohydrate kinase [Photobacterium sp.]